MNICNIAKSFQVRSQHLERTTGLNRICPYFTRFPLQFPLVKMRESQAGQWMLDPFCGAGTALFAARLLGLGAVGVDSSRVAVVIARAKLCRVSPEAVMDKAATILKRVEPVAMPEDMFWEHCFAPRTLKALSLFRAYFMSGKNSPVDVTLRALLLGMLHGPQPDGPPRFFSNHLAADFAPHPREAIGLWTQRRLKPPECNVLRMIQQRAVYLLGRQPAPVSGVVHEGDSRKMQFADSGRRFDWVVTSPPYYGMNSYPIDQWLRNWLLGGPSFPEGNTDGQISQQTLDAYIADLARVWKNVAAACQYRARLIVRIGNVPGIKAPPAVELLKMSLNRAACGWKIITCTPVHGHATSPKETSLFRSPASWPENETEVVARYEP